MKVLCGGRYAVVFDDSIRLFVIVPTSCDVGYKYSVGIRRLKLGVDCLPITDIGGITSLGRPFIFRFEKAAVWPLHLLWF